QTVPLGSSTARERTHPGQVLRLTAPRSGPRLRVSAGLRPASPTWVRDLGCLRGRRRVSVYDSRRCSVRARVTGQYAGFARLKSSEGSVAEGPPPAARSVR